MSPDRNAPTVACEQLRFGWSRAATLIDIERFDIDAGETVFLQGASGCGKSTLLALIAGVVAARSGTVTVLGNDLGKLGGGARDRLRGSQIGYIAQQFNLIPHLTVLDNVLLPAAFSAERRERARARGGEHNEASRLLAALGLDFRDLQRRTASQLSQGQQQRVAAARALFGQPRLLIADEPTSALDSDTRDNFLRLLLRECAQTGAALLFVSHDRDLARHFDRCVAMQTLNRAASAC